RRHGRVRDARSRRGDARRGADRSVRWRAHRRRRAVGRLSRRRESARASVRRGREDPGMTAEILRTTGEHVLIVAASVSIAVVLGIPLGIWCTRSLAMSRVALRLIDAIQTIPSLALFGFLIPVPFIGGIGMRTAIVALI